MAEGRPRRLSSRVRGGQAPESAPLATPTVCAPFRHIYERVVGVSVGLQRSHPRRCRCARAREAFWDAREPGWARARVTSGLRHRITFPRADGAFIPMGHSADALDTHLGPDLRFAVVLKDELQKRSQFHTRAARGCPAIREDRLKCHGREPIIIFHSDDQ